MEKEFIRKLTPVALSGRSEKKKTCWPLDKQRSLFPAYEQPTNKGRDWRPLHSTICGLYFSLLATNTAFRHFLLFPTFA